MNSTNRHLAFAILWLVALPAVVVPVVIASEPGALSTVSSRIASIVWVLGFAAIFYSWARIDAPLHGKSSKAALGFAVAWPVLLVFSHIAYLLYTRGVSMGLISILKFSCFLLAVGILWLAVGRILGGVIDSKNTGQVSLFLGACISDRLPALQSPMTPNPSFKRTRLRRSA